MTSTALKSPLKSALRTAHRPAAPLAQQSAEKRHLQLISGATLRQVAMAEFELDLSTRPNKRGLPFSPHTISAYMDAAKALDRWMTSRKIDADFTACDDKMVNQFLAEHAQVRSVSGAATIRSNLRNLFAFLERDRAHPSPYTCGDVHRYAAVRKPKTLDPQYVLDVLKACGDGRAATFMEARDYAILRCLTEGLRRSELLGMQLSDLADNPYANDVIQVVPLKGARVSGRGRLVQLAPKTIKALVTYRRIRAAHKLAELSALWISERSRGELRDTGLTKLVQRRTRQAGWDPATVTPHMFRHTLAHDMLAAGMSEGDVMRHFGWTDRSMIDRYGADLAQDRAIAAKRELGNLY